MEFQFSGKCVFSPKVLVCRRKINCSEIFFNFNFARKKLISHENNTSAFNYSDEKMFLLSGIANNVCLFFFLHDRRNSGIFFKLGSWRAVKTSVCSSHAKPYLVKPHPRPSHTHKIQSPSRRRISNQKERYLLQVL